MPRTLPWMQKGGSSNTASRPKNAATATKRPLKRSRSDKSDSDSTAEQSRKSSKGKGHGQSSSPPPEPPSEELMFEGAEHDDKYRMVEDEFLTVAQKWTVHLHAAEYKRQEKMVKARNAETINSISRPVTARMPDQTKRKVQAVARSKVQKNAIEELLVKEEAADDTDESIEDGLPYVGTTLHGLMDSPRRKAALLSKVGSARVATRASVGLPAQSTTNSSTKLTSYSPVSRGKHQIPVDDSTASSDEDDDLDAPIAAPKLKPISSVSKPCSLNSNSAASSSTVLQMSRVQGPTVFRSELTKSTVKGPLPAPNSTASDAARASDVSQRRARRQELARQEKDRQEQEGQKERRDVIPTFL